MIIAAVMIRRCCRRSVFFATQREPTNRAAARSWHASAPPTSVFAAEVARDQNIRENPIRHKQSARMSWILERARGNITLVPSSNYAFVRSGKKQKVLIACSLFRLFLLPFSGFLPLPLSSDFSHGSYLHSIRILFGGESVIPFGCYYRVTQ